MREGEAVTCSLQEQTLLHAVLLALHTSLVTIIHAQ
jgi:hypothetical protein